MPVATLAAVPSAERGRFHGRAAPACIPHKGCSLHHQPLLFQPSKSLFACLVPQVQAGACRRAVHGKPYLRGEQRGCSVRRDILKLMQQETCRGIYHQKQLVQAPFFLSAVTVVSYEGKKCQDWALFGLELPPGGAPGQAPCLEPCWRANNSAAPWGTSPFLATWCPHTPTDMYRWCVTRTCAFIRRHNR